MRGGSILAPSVSLRPRVVANTDAYLIRSARAWRAFFPAFGRNRWSYPGQLDARIAGSTSSGWLWGGTRAFRPYGCGSRVRACTAFRLALVAPMRGDHRRETSAVHGHAGAPHLARRESDAAAAR